MTGNQPLTFIIEAGALSCSPPGLTVLVDAATGGFQTDIDISNCPTSLFDGTDATVDVSVNGKVVVTAKPVSPVPHAKYADKVGSADCPVGYDKDPKPASPFSAASIADGPLAGVFSLELEYAPSGLAISLGLRCVLPR